MSEKEGDRGPLPTFTLRLRGGSSTDEERRKAQRKKRRK